MRKRAPCAPFSFFAKGVYKKRRGVYNVTVKSVTGRRTGGRSEESAALAVSGISPAVDVHP